MATMLYMMTKGRDLFFQEDFHCSIEIHSATLSLRYHLTQPRPDLYGHCTAKFWTYFRCGKEYLREIANYNTAAFAKIVALDSIEALKSLPVTT
jgi:hypothetical protein